MAEARRVEDEEQESLRGEPREPAVRRQLRPTGERHKEHRLSQGPLSSIRAAIKRTSPRSTSLSESNPRDRRRPEITILSAEPLASNTWFPGASGGFPPPPPPAAMIWGSSIPPTIQPPPSYDEVIREKSQVQVQVLPPSSSSTSSSSPRRSVSTTTIATQTDAGLEFSAAAHGHAPNQRRSVARRPPFKAKPSHADDTTSHADDTTSHADDTTGSATVDSLIFLEDSPALHTHTHTVAHTEETRSTAFHYELLTSDPFSPLTSASGSQTDQWGQSSFVLPPHSTIVLTTPSDPPLPHNQPRPRPRTKNSLRPIRREVKVQTLVRLGQTGTEVTENQEGSHRGGKYLQELLDAFSSDDWGFPDHHSNDKVESDLRAEEEEEEEEEDMRARIQEDHGNHADSDQGDGDFLGGGRPEPRPRIQAPPKPAPPVTPKPSLAAKTSRKGLWEDGCSMAIDVNLTVDTVTTSQSTPSLPSPKPTEAPSSTPALSPVPVTSPSTPVPAPRPLLPGKPPSEPQRPNPQVGQTEGAPPRPPVAPRTNGAVVPQERSTVVGQPTPALPPKPSIDLHSTNTRPSVGQKSTAVSSSRRASVPLPASGLAVPENRRPSLVSKPFVQTPIPTSPVPLTPAVAPSLVPLTPAVAPSLVPLTPAVAPSPVPLTPAIPTSPVPLTPAVAPSPVPLTPAVAPSPVGPRPPVLPSAPAQKKTPLVSSECEPPLPPRPQGLFKMLPLRPPPIKTVIGRHPPLQAVSTSSTTSSNQPPPPQAVATPSTTSANQTQGQRAPKKGPPLPLRPKPGHPLYKSYMLNQ